VANVGGLGGVGWVPCAVVCEVSCGILVWDGGAGGTERFAVEDLLREDGLGGGGDGAAGAGDEAHPREGELLQRGEGDASDDGHERAARAESHHERHECHERVRACVRVCVCVRMCMWVCSMRARVRACGCA
jgi:hypothetical protein